MMEESRTKVLEFNPRLLKRLQKENAQLRDMIGELVEIVRRNERIHKQLSRIEEKILQTRSIEEMVRTIVSETRRRFRIPFVTLSICIDRDDNKRSTLGSKGLRMPRNLLFVPRERLEGAFPSPPVPILKDHKEDNTGLFFHKSSLSRISSFAIIPLQFHGRLIGSLNFGSRKPDRFGPGHGVDLLEEFSKKIALLLSSFIENRDASNPQEREREIIVAAGAVILNGEGEVLLVRQIPGIDNYWKGKWICPGGRIERGEAIEEAVHREVEEETHLKIRLIKPLSPFERIVKEDGRVKLHVIYIDYLAELKGGKLRPDDDVGEAIWVHPSELNNIIDELHEDTRRLMRIAGIL